MLKENINRILKDMSFLDDEPLETNHLKDDLGLDSLRMVELMVAIEEMFEIEFNMEDLNPANINFVSDLYEIVGKYKEVV